MTTHFSEDLLPLEVCAWAVGGRGFKTTRVETYGGDAYKNAAWDQALGEWDISAALRNTNPSSTYAVYALRKFIMAARGELGGFRFRDPSDHADEGHGILTLISGSLYQMYKRYAITSLTYDQIIQKPVTGTIALVGGTGTIDYTTGIVTRVSGTLTGWTGTFDIPVEFADDIPRIGYESSGAFFEWQQIKLREWRNWATS